MNKKNVQIASFGQFHIPQLVQGLSEIADVKYMTNWSPKRPPPSDFGTNPGLCRHLHYPLKAFERYPILQKGSWMHYGLAVLFDQWLTSRIRPDLDVFYLHNGSGLSSLERVRSTTDAQLVVDSGSTHIDWQHRIVQKEFKRNGLSTPLFSSGYRTRCRKEVDLADFVQIPSNFVKRSYLEEGVPESKLLLAPYGTDLRIFKPREYEQNRPFRVLCMSGFNLRKGARILVEAWRKLSLRDAELHWVGNMGPDVTHLFAEPLPGLVKHSHLSHEQLAGLCRSCDVLVLPSFEEGLARVLIEGAACGLALIATPNSGVEDIFQPGVDMGWLVETGSSDSLAEAILQAAGDRDLTHRHGANAAIRARANFGLDSYFKRVQDNFKHISNTC